MKAWRETEPIFRRSAIEGWEREAACASLSSQSSFFPTKGENIKLAAARQICSNCPVQTECLKFALKTKQQYGIWGGLSEEERHHLTTGRAKRVGKCKHCGLIRVYFEDASRLCDACNGITKLDRKSMLNQLTGLSQLV